MDLEHRTAAAVAGFVGAIVAALLTAAGLVLVGAPLDRRGVASLVLQSLAAVTAGVSGAYFLAPSATAALVASLRAFVPALAPHLDFAGTGLVSAVGFIIGLTFWRVAPVALDTLAHMIQKRGA